MIAMTRRRYGGKVLPYDAEVEYLENTGTQWINLPVSVAKGDAFGVEIRFILLTTSAGYNIWNSNVTSAFRSWTYSYNSTSKAMTLASYIGGNATNGGWNAIYGEVTDCIVSTTQVGTRVLNRIITAFTNLRLLDSFKCKLMSFNVEHEGSVIYNLIPVRKGTTGYLYDKVSGQLFGNSGTGAFVVGPDVISGGVVTNCKPAIYAALAERRAA